MSRKSSFVGKANNANSLDDNSKDFKSYMGARVQWPADVADDTLEKTITKILQLSQQYNQVTEGKKVVEELKNYMDKEFEPNWHVFSGTNFGSHVTHEKRQFIFFYVEKIAYLCFKIG